MVRTMIRWSLEKCWLEPAWWLTGIGFIVLIPAVWKKLKCLLPVSVNCWFCNKNAKINYTLRNSWNCPYCEQYNGFNQDGGYNKVLEEQHQNVSNGKIFNVLKSSIKEVSVKNGLCNMCNLNQQLKIHQLAHFVPIREENYDEEMERYRKLLEKSYHLCAKCELVVDDTLKKQQSELNIPLDLNFEREKPENVTFRNDLKQRKSVIRSSLEIVSKFIAVWLAIISVCRNYKNDYLFGRESITVYQAVFGSGKFVRELSGLGFLSYFLSTWGRPKSGVEGINMILWLTSHCLAWSTWSSLLSAVCLAVFVFTFSVEFVVGISGRRRVGIRPEPEAQVRGSGSDLLEKERPPVAELSEGKESSRNGREKETEKDSDFVFDWSRQSEGKESSSHVFKNNIRTNSERFIYSTEPTEAEPPVYSEKINRDMINLNLGTTGKEKEKEKFKRSGNFLFQNHNFGTEKKKSTFSLLKPAKFFSGTPNFTPSAKYQKSMTATWTPSLCFGPNSDGSDFKDCYYFPPSKYCFPVERTDLVSRLNDLDYHGNDFYPWSDSVYTCGIEANISFPSKNYASDTVCPSFPGMGFHSESEGTGSPVKSRPTSKSVFYALSVFLNLTTLCFLVYRLWPDLIVFDFKLPIFNFYV